MSDSTAIAKGTAAEAGDIHGDAHPEHPAYQRHHFESVDQQFDATNFAMWLFLLTEIMFFGGLFASYLIMRNWYYRPFVEGSHQLSIFWGTANTAVLIVSSFTMAMAVWSAEVRRKGSLLLCLSLTLVLGSPSSASRALSGTKNGRSTTFPASTITASVVSRSRLGPGGA